ncbi:hypothetical protein DXG03_009084 [Asterophora parasitica]|uniref:Uncharacterized protein n=1 Tax=Asterophora parasitica TaxID=117018 RepID=A0A9P7GBE4_9AGAR|nr:hypothetical protein DXG03_009084 [Asterophora parasitica]
MPFTRYDVAGASPERVQSILERDWVHLIREKGVLDSPNYLREKGKPVIGLWGFGFDGAGHTPELVRAITTYFREVTPGGVYILGGAPAHWRTAESDADRNADFLDVWLNEFDAISPWTIGRYGNEQQADDFAETKLKGDVELIKKRNEEGRKKIDYIPVVYPGGSRNGGRFLWKQIANAKRQGVRTIYGAMWDEYDEGTALMPVVEKKRLLPESDKHLFMALDQDGYDLPSDWYMRICGFAAEGLRSERRIHESFPSKELQDYWSSRPRFEDVDPKSGDFVSGTSKNSEGTGGSGEDGQSYQEWLAARKSEDKEEPPPPPYSLEADETPESQLEATPTSTVVPESPIPPTPVERAPTSTPVTSEPRTSSPPVATTAIPTHVATGITPSRPTHQASGPPPINTGSRPDQSSNISQQPPPSVVSANGPSVASPVSALTNANTYPWQTYGNTQSDAHDDTSSQYTAGGPSQDPVSALANHFGQHGIGSSSPDPRPASLPPPLHPAHPSVALGGRPQSSNAGPQPRPQAQSGYAASYLPTQASLPQGSGSWSQAQWPPAEWGIGGSSQPQPYQTPPPIQQSSYPGQNTQGANLSRPQTSSYSSPSSLHPSASLSGAAPGASSYTPGGPPMPGGPSFPAIPGGGSPYPPSSPNPGQGGPSPYGHSLYNTHGPGNTHAPYGSPPHSPPPGGAPSFPGGSYYPGQAPSHGFPSAHGSSYPGQSSYGSGPPPVSSQPPYGPGSLSSNGPPQGGGFHVPQAQGYYGVGIPQPSAGWGYGQSASSAPYGSPSPHASMPSPSSGWSGYPGNSGPSTPSSVPPRPPSHSSYSGSSSLGPSSSSSGMLGSALSAVDKMAGRKAKDQLESIAQSEVTVQSLSVQFTDTIYSNVAAGTKLFNKFTK